MIKDINAITPEYMKYRIEQETGQYKQEIERLENIIKEVREYTNKMMTLAERKGKNGEENGALYVAVADILEILDKTN